MFVFKDECDLIIHFDLFSVFDIFDLAVFLLCMANGAKISFASVLKFVSVLKYASCVPQST